MPLLDLQQHLKMELEGNPFLEMAEADLQEEVELKEDGKDESAEDDVDWEDILLEGFDTGERREQYEVRDFFQPTPVESMSLRDHLYDQLRMLNITEREMRLGEEIIGNVNDAGMLTCSLQDVLSGLNDWLTDMRDTAQIEIDSITDKEELKEAQDEVNEAFSPYDISEAETMLPIIQTFEPAGIAARDLQESLLIQLRILEKHDTKTYRIIDTHFENLINHRWPEIAIDLGIESVEIQSVADEISKLDPKPGLKYSADPERYIIPDLIVEKIEGEYMVFVNDTSLPRLRISESYRNVASEKSNLKSEHKAFISKKLNSATWMIQAIEQRRQTMLKVMGFIVERQLDFFELGIQHLKPLTLREVADHIGMHESTISRVTNEKYVQTPRGVLHLKFFFSSGLPTITGEGISATGVKDKVRKLVYNENPLKPLTDQKIVELLKEDGIKIARRTIAKYRDQLGILPARMRKRV